MEEFEKGKILETASGGKIEIIEKIGAGGQGIVYKVRYADNCYAALKWYYKEKIADPEKFYWNLKENIRKKAPTPSFLWPLEITKEYDGSFGYVMDLCPPEYKEFRQFLLAKERFSSVKAVIRAALEIVNGFRELHNRGYSYQDLNDGSLFINPETGAVLICDNDNVAPYGDNLGIAGKLRYMAPEVVLRKKRPDIHTDRFSMAVILYMLLFMNHPLEGRRAMCPCLTEEMEKKIYGSEPLFVWDPGIDANRPVRGVHINELRLWPVYPERVREMFVRAFSQAALSGDQTEHRVMEKEWQELFVYLRDQAALCNCREEIFLDPSQPVTRCASCGREISRQLTLNVKKYQVPLIPGKKLYSCHTANSDDFRTETGEVIRSKKQPAVRGLRNLSKTTWEAIIPNGTTKQIPPEGVTPLGKGLEIRFSPGNTGKVN